MIGSDCKRRQDTDGTTRNESLSGDLADVMIELGDDNDNDALVSFLFSVRIFRCLVMKGKREFEGCFFGFVAFVESE